ncbi:hypothetical protein DXB04_24890 [Enterocloster bolteae]|nr:hypothetical protein DXB04_24890 [Enterocloster bolteae]
MEGFAGWGQGREKKGGIEEKQREGTGSLDSWFLRGLSLSRNGAAQGDREKFAELLMSSPTCSLSLGR